MQQLVLNVVSYMFKWKRLISGSDDSQVPGSKTVADVKCAQAFLVKFVQQQALEDLQNSVDMLDGCRVHGRYRRLAPYVDSDGIWRIGLRMKEYTPFTRDSKPPVFLPHESRLTRLIMEYAHQKKHCGIEETVSRFRMM